MGSNLSRRAALGAFTVAAAGLSAGAAYAKGNRVAAVPVRAKAIPRPRGLVKAENARAGSAGWDLRGYRTADDVRMIIKGYASHTSITAGEQLSFHVSTGEEFGIDVYRVGAYGGAGARLVCSSPPLAGVRQPAARVDEATGLISAGWDAVWRLTVPDGWLSGYYMAAFTTASGWRNYTAFVVRDHRRADLCAVLPFTTYQAYNRWPFDGITGRNLYLGPDPGGPMSYLRRARKVGFDRPYDSDGRPPGADLDLAFIRWAEAADLDITYATSDDLHAGRIDPRRYRGLVFSGHDEYWTAQMRDHADRAVAGGTSLAFLSANNSYWRMRFEPDAAGRADRVIACYKSDPDPGGTATLRWRDPNPDGARPEQQLLGVMYNGIVKTPAPLVVRESGHWLWTGTGVRDGDRIPGVVAGEADGFMEGIPVAAGNLTLASASPYVLKGLSRTKVQNTSLLETPSGALVFAAGSRLWPQQLTAFGDIRVRRLTANVLGRIISH